MDFVAQSRVVHRRHATLGKAEDPEIRKLRAFELTQQALIKEAFDKFVSECKSDQVVDDFKECYEKNRLVQAMAVTDGAVEDFAQILDPVFVNAGNWQTKQLVTALDITVAKIEVSPDINISFDAGSAEAARELRSSMLDMIREITEKQREAIRAALSRALEEGMSPTEAARLFRSQIGLTNHQMKAVTNYRNLLQTGSSDALGRALRDRRFDTTLDRAITSGTQLSTSQIDRMVERYQQRMLDMRAETIARTEMMGATNAARHEATAQMANKVDLHMSRIQRTWRTTMVRSRDTHIAMNRQVRGADEAFVSPSGAKIMFPGDRRAPAEERINCRCSLLIKILPPQEVAPTPVTPVKPRVPRKPTSQPVPEVYGNLRTHHTDTFSDGFVNFQNNAQASEAFNQLNTQMLDMLKKAEAANVAAADKLLQAAVKSAEALDLAAAKEAAKYTRAVKEAAKTRGLGAAETLGGEEVVGSSKVKYYVPKDPKAKLPAPKKKTYLIPDQKRSELHQLAKEMYNEGLTAKLTKEEIESLNKYTTSRYTAINKGYLVKRLRTPEYFDHDDMSDLRSSVDADIANMDSAFGKASFPEDVVVYRGMSSRVWKTSFSSLRVGQTVVIDKAVVSTSLSLQEAGFWAMRAHSGFRIEISIPKGAKAISLDPISLNTGEFEILIARGAKFIVKELTDKFASLEMVL